jgi:hypothetical protein
MAVQQFGSAEIIAIASQLQIQLRHVELVKER